MFVNCFRFDDAMVETFAVTSNKTVNMNVHHQSLITSKMKYVDNIYANASHSTFL